MALPRASPPAPPAHILVVGRDILVSILGLLGHSDLGRALCTCRATADVADDAWKAACYRRWPLWARRAEEGATAAADWRRTYELLELREGEARCVPDLGAIHRLQTRITEAHRAILAEWLCEVRARALPPPAHITPRRPPSPAPPAPPQVSFEWRLDTAVVHKAVEYLDHFLVGTRVDQLSRCAIRARKPLLAAPAPRATPSSASPDRDTPAPAQVPARRHRLPARLDGRLAAPAPGAAPPRREAPRRGALCPPLGRHVHGRGGGGAHPGARRARWRERAAA